MCTFDIGKIPFSRYGSYMAVSHLPYRVDLPAGYRREVPEAAYLRTVRGGAKAAEVARFVLLQGGKPVPYAEEAGPGELVLTGGSVRARLCFADPLTLLVKTEGKDVGLRLEVTPAAPFFAFATEVPCPDATRYLLNCFGQYTKFLLWAQEGEMRFAQSWEGCVANDVRFCTEGECLLVIRECYSEWDGQPVHYSYGEALSGAEADYAAFAAKMPAVSPAYRDAAALAAYVDWSAVVAAGETLKRNGMLMSKNWMLNVWAWDHVFNAVALSYGNPKEAWNQWMVLFDHQDGTGRIPDSINNARADWGYCKPPVHGWALHRMMQVMALSEGQMAEAYDKLEKWTDWWLNYRDHDQDGICEYTHGYDSGWDNATAFSKVPPVESPDLTTFLILQMDTLAELAGRLGRDSSRKRWEELSAKTLSAMLSHCFVDGKPVTVHSASHEVTECSCLLNYMPVMLGRRLPGAIREGMVETLKSRAFHTPFGLATESVESPAYEEDGYWRGPIWAPAMLLFIDGLKSCGEEAFADTLAREFCDMVKENGFAENFNALNGRGNRDLAYTWTPSVFLTLAHELHEKEIG